MKTKLIFTALAFFAITSIGFSQNNQPQNQSGRKQGNCQSWVDENKNGICDNYEKRTPANGGGKGSGYCGGRNQGQPGKGMMNRQGRGKDFADENKNGICDRYENARIDQVEKK